MNRRYPITPTTAFLSFLCAGAMTAATSCSTTGVNRGIASQDASNSDFDQELSSLGVHSYRANLHSHHFMRYKPSKKSGLTEEFLGPGACKVQGSFPEDDARPCRDNGDGEAQFVMPASGDTANRLDYFKMACEYARTEGELDVLFITPHTKNDKNESDTDTSRVGMQARHDLLKDMNDAYGGKFFCGMGQEASSISTGNHMNIIGHMPVSVGKIEPFFFPSGQFDKLFPEVKARRAAGETPILMLNHPDVQHDLFWKPWAEVAGNKSKKKELLNDYGLDDYAPVGCMVKGPAAVGCDAEQEVPTQLTNDLLQKTYENIRNASGDSFRLVEMVSPGGAADNSTVAFRKVQKRTAPGDGVTDSGPNDVPNGLHDYIFYLNMGFKVGPAADQDNHYYNYGAATASRTGLLASSLDEAQIVNAIEHRHTFASEDKNARIFLASDKHLMGDGIKVSSDTVHFDVGYSDPDAADNTAEIRFYYYTEKQALDFIGPKRNVLRFVSFHNGHAQLPTAAPASYVSPTPDGDQLLIHSGEVRGFDIPVAAGIQYVFVEVTQTGDQDKIWSAPIWIKR